MPYNSNIHKRRSIRLKDYDYSSENLYFITICSNQRECLFGRIIENNVILNDCGEIIKKWYFEIENKYSNIICLDYVIMPNHIHFIIRIIDYITNNDNKSQTLADVGSVVQWFKTMITNEYIRNVYENNWKPFDKRLFQRNYYETIIRDPRFYNLFSNYIKDNPSNWDNDKYAIK